MTTPASATATWARLARMRAGPTSHFDPGTVRDLPLPAQRLLTRALPPGAPLVTGIELQMTGEIRLKDRWIPFHADQILRAGAGFVWRPDVGHGILRFAGADVLGPDGARVEFLLHGLIPVVRASGPDVVRSAAGRLAAETVAWLPQALTPQAGAVWTGIDHDMAAVSVDAAGRRIDVEVTVDPRGRLRSVSLQRWNSSVQPPRLDSFGGRVDEEHITTDGVHVAGAGSVGWGWGTPKWSRGEFFRYSITSISSLDG